MVSVDLQPMVCFSSLVQKALLALTVTQAPLPNITILHTDITLPSTVPLVLDALGGRKADLVVCDGAPDGSFLTSHLHVRLTPE